MLRITILDHGGWATVKLEGRLVGPWAEELRSTVLAAMPRFDRLQVDLSDVTFADVAGEEVLVWLHRLGADFQGVGVFSEGLCQRLKNSPSTQPRGGFRGPLRRHARPR